MTTKNIYIATADMYFDNSVTIVGVKHILMT